MLELKDYKVSYGESCVIRNLNLKIKKGEIVALLGRNGIGKTTLMKSIIGMIPAQKGECILDGQDLIHTKSYKRVASGIGFVPQGRILNVENLKIILLSSINYILHVIFMNLPSHTHIHF